MSSHGLLHFTIRAKGQLALSQLGHRCGHIMLNEEDKARGTKCHTSLAKEEDIWETSNTF